MKRWTSVVADQDPRTRDMISRSLSPTRFDIVIVSDADELTTAIAGCDRALVLVSEALPGLDTSSLADRLVDACVFAYTVFLLDHYDAQRVTRAFEAGADDAIAKPLIASELRARLQHAARLLALEQVRSDLESEGSLIAEIATRASFHSRLYLDSQLEMELARGQRFSHSLAIVLGEIGTSPPEEQTMRGVGQFLSGRLRSKVDWIARFDRNKYAFVLPETPLAGALCVARRLRADLSDGALLTSNGLPRSLQTRFGVSAVDLALCPPDGAPEPETLLTAAEAYLSDTLKDGRGPIAAGPELHQ